MSKGSSQGLSWILILARLGFVGYGWSISVSAVGPLPTQTTSAGSGQLRAGHTLLIPGPQGSEKAQEAPWPPGRHMLGPNDSTSHPSTCVFSAGDKSAGSGFGAMCLKQCFLPPSVSQICFLEWRILATGPWSSVGSGQTQPSENNDGKQHVQGIFQVIALSTQNHLGRRYLLILQREVPDCCSLGA